MDRSLRVVDGDTFEFQGETIRLFGIDAPEQGQPCDRAAALRDCGAWSKAVLTKALGQGQLTCKAKDIDRYGRTVAQCWVAGKDLGKTMVQEGAAKAYRKYSSLYVTTEAEAKTAGRGIWATAMQDPEEFRHLAAPALTAPQLAPKTACAIKGNINAKGERIYHRPGQRDYDATKINVKKGEAWFCSEVEAKAAGFRAARR